MQYFSQLYTKLSKLDAVNPMGMQQKFSIAFKDLAEYFDINEKEFSDDRVSLTSANLSMREFKDNAKHRLNTSKSKDKKSTTINNNHMVIRKEGNV